MKQVLVMLGLALLTGGCVNESAPVVSSLPPTPVPVEHTERAYGTSFDTSDFSIVAYEPQRFLTSSTAFSSQGYADQPAWRVQFTLTNNQAQILNPAGLRVEAVTGDAVQQEVTDRDNSCDGLLTAAPIAPSDRRTLTVCFTANDPHTHPAVTFTELHGPETVTFSEHPSV